MRTPEKSLKCQVGVGGITYVKGVPGGTAGQLEMPPM